MSFITGFLLGRVVAERQGISDESTLTRMALLGGVMGATPTGIIMTSILAQREAENAAPPVSVPPTPPVARVEVPDVIKDSFNEAKKRLEALGLVVVSEDLYSMSTPKGHIINQTPSPKSVVPQGTQITLSVSLGAEIPTGEEHNNCPTPPKATAGSGQDGAKK